MSPNVLQYHYSMNQPQQRDPLAQTITTPQPAPTRKTKRSRKTVIIICVTVIVVGAIIIAALRPNTPPPASGYAAVILSHEYTDYNGRTVKLNDFVGLPMVIMSWSTDCNTCGRTLAEFARFSSLMRQYFDVTAESANERIITIGINRAEGLDAAKAFSDKASATNDILQLLDPDDAFYAGIQGETVPETIIIDRSGVIREHIRGPIGTTDLRQRVNSIFGI